jgi:hypothetical protein
MNLLLPESSGRNRYWLSLRHPLNLDVDVGVDVHLSAFHGLMAQPERDRRAVHAVLSNCMAVL